MSTNIPDEETISKAAEQVIYGSQGEKLKFGSLFEDKKTIVVFIRHFFCGSCQGYVSQLAQVSQSSLDKANANLVIIGCGEWSVISAYAEITKFSGAIYANPSRELYQTLGMNTETLARTPPGQKRRLYLPSSLFSGIIQSIRRGPLQHPTLIGKQGNISQVGGEFIFGPGKICSFTSRMQHTEDHVEVEDLMAAAGVQYNL